ncbi:protein of unknown function [Blastococcus saxobsidens DD2]|uniref:Uncharacterized protein n=1 Tax=Blastococcus saxobsidens (strain DD2) TaxID=1146883 RepID=H6RN77_BLASD|nr:protein of unknown function [Blastococcus saxobsidens DD2]
MPVAGPDASDDHRARRLGEPPGLHSSPLTPPLPRRAPAARSVIPATDVSSLRPRRIRSPRQRSAHGPQGPAANHPDRSFDTHLVERLPHSILRGVSPNGSE